MKYSHEEIEEHQEDLHRYSDNASLKSMQIIEDLLNERIELRQNARPPIIIEYRVKNVYGRDLEFIADPNQARIIQNLCRQKTIDSVIRELLRNLTNGLIIWKQII